jgi:hypothetical protein
MWIFIGACALFLAGMFWNGRRQEARERAERDQRDNAELELIRTGTRLRAKVRRASQWGTSGLLPYLELSLTVEAPEGEYDVDVKLAVDAAKLHLVAEGSVVDVAVDPENREHLCVLL